MRRLRAAAALRSDGPPQHEFYVSDLSSNFSHIARVFLGDRVAPVRQVSSEEIIRLAMHEAVRTEAVL